MSFGSSEYGWADTKLVAILLARPENSFTKNEILPSLQYFHIRAAKHLNVYRVGWHRDPCQGYKPIDSPRTPGEQWYFSDVRFEEIRKEIEKRTKWQYSGGVDLLLVNACFLRDEPIAYFDFSSSLSIDVAQASRMVLSRPLQSFSSPGARGLSIPGA
jgi:hypothetical protein